MALFIAYVTVGLCGFILSLDYKEKFKNIGFDINKSSDIFMISLIFVIFFPITVLFFPFILLYAFLFRGGMHFETKTEKKTFVIEFFLSVCWYAFLLNYFIF